MSPMNEKPPEETEETLDEESFSFESEYRFEDWDDVPPEEASRILKGLEGLIPDVVKRTMSNVLWSDDGVRSLLTEKNLPKEVVGYVLGQVDATRRGILRIVSKEIRVFLENMDFGGEIAKILTTLSFEIRTEIRFIPNEERVVPSVRNSVRVRRDGDAAEEPPEPEQTPPSEPAPPAESVRKEARKPAARWTRRRPADDE